MKLLGDSKFLDKPWTTFFLFGSIGLTLLSTVFLSLYRSANSEQNIITNRLSFYYFMGDIPKEETGEWNFDKMVKVDWKEGSGWTDTEHLAKIAEEPIIWIRFDLTNSNSPQHGSFVFLHTIGVDLVAFDSKGNVVFQTEPNLNAVRNVPIFAQKYLWIPISESYPESLFLRVFHTKGYLFSIVPLSLQGNQKEVILKEFANINLIPILFMSFFLVLGIISCTIYLIEYKKKYNLLLDFAAFCFLFGLMGMASNPFFLYLSNVREEFFLCSFLASNFVFIPMHSGLRRLFGSGKFKLLDILIYFNLIFGISMMVLGFSLDHDPLAYQIFINLRVLFVLMNIINIGGSIFVSYYAYKAGKKESIGLILGFSITLILILVEMYFSLHEISSTVYFVYWGVLFGVFAQGLTLEKAIFSHRQTAQNYREDLLKAERSLKEVQLKTLQTKMSPHYLFNSLNTIHAMHKINPSIAGDAILRLANNYRFISDRTDRDWIPFEEEWSFLEDYLHIQKLRFFDTVEIEFKKTGDFSSVVLPPLLLQPIIENSFKHGFRNQTGSLFKLFINAKMVSESRFSFVVYDNGPGLPEELLANPNKTFERSLGNIRERLKNLYQDFRFELTQNFPQGARTEIEIVVSSRIHLDFAKP